MKILFYLFFHAPTVVVFSEPHGSRYLLRIRVLGSGFQPPIELHLLHIVADASNASDLDYLCSFKLLRLRNLLLCTSATEATSLVVEPTHDCAPVGLNSHDYSSAYKENEKKREQLPQHFSEVFETRAPTIKPRHCRFGAHFLPARTFAHLALVAALIRASPAGEM